MKKVYLLFVAATLAACSAEPVENFELNSLDAAVAGKNNFKSTEVVYEGLDITGFETVSFDLIKIHPNDSSKDEVKGKVFVSNDCQYVYFKVEGADDINLGIYTDQADFPVQNGEKNTVSPEQPITEENFTNMIYSVPVGSLEQVYVFVNAGGHSWGGDKDWGTAKYFIYKLQLDSCSNPCPNGKGYWRNHSDDNPGNQENMWPVNELNLGNHRYDRAELNEIMDVPNNEGNNLVIFSQHLIAAKLNVANGAGTIEIVGTIEEADDLIGDLVVLQDSFSEEQKKTSNALKNILEAYNEASCEETSGE